MLISWVYRWSRQTSQLLTCTGGDLGVDMSMAPRDFPEDDEDGDHSQPDLHDDADLGFDAGPPAGALDPLAAFFKELAATCAPLGAFSGRASSSMGGPRRGAIPLICRGIGSGERTPRCAHIHL